MMKIDYRLLIPFAAWIVFAGCGSSKKLSSPYDEIRILDTMLVTAPAMERGQSDSLPKALPEYQAANTRLFDLLHTRLEVSFDWETESVNGNAVLVLKPYFYPANRLVLDAKEFDIQEIVLEGTDHALDYDYDGYELDIRLDRMYRRTDTLRIQIRYTARPNASGGGWAITSDQGLFFINADGEDPAKPRQIWTQGETENNSRWFPTIDKPNERCTQEIFITVGDHFKTLSNGALVSSVKNPDGTRTDYWKMDQPHAPYLFMLAVGDYAVVEERWRSIPVQYYVEPEFEADAKAIFPYTTEMLEFFSNLLDYPYPWPKFAQVVVRDFVTGAMENTTAVVFGEFMYGKTRELVDLTDNEQIVAHEMFHQWFGDLVTCESWANLTLNEGFANYSEYLWLEHKHGPEEADFHLISETDDYIYSSRNDAHPLIHFRYSQREDMFDAHSYNKGGLTMHMLRKYLGDEAFFAGLNHYLVENAYSDVEADELRLAMEEVSGRDLNWFFDQWFFGKGHPILDIHYGYDAPVNETVVKITQNQFAAGMPAIFEFPVAIRIFLPDGSVREEKAWIREREAELRFSVPEKPLLVLFDPERVLLCERTENKSETDYAQQYRLAPNVRDRQEALQMLSGEGYSKMEQLWQEALDDTFWGIRLFALENLELQDVILPRIARLVAEDPHAKVRSAACYILGQSEDPRFVPDLEKVIDNDFSAYAVASALDALNTVSPEKGMAKAETLEAGAQGLIRDVIAEIYINAQDTGKLDYLLSCVNTADDYSSIYYLMGYLQLSKKTGIAQLLESSEVFFRIASAQGTSVMKRYAGMRALNEIHAELLDRSQAGKAGRERYLSADKEVLEKIESIKAEESDPELRNIFRSFPDPRIK